MRIALVSQEYPPETAQGGIGTQTYQKAHGLAALGHEVHVITHSTDENKHTYDDGPVHVTRIPSFDKKLDIHTDQVRWLTYSVGVAEAVSELHSRLPLDLIDFPEWGGEGYIYLLNRAEWNYVPTVVHIHGPMVMMANTIGWPEKNSEFYRIGTEMEGTCLRLADAVFSSSICSAEWCSKHYSLSRDKIPIIHTGIDTEIFYPLDISKEEKPTIICVGRIERNKGMDLLLNAACELAHDFPDLQLRILGIGNQSFINELRAKSKACNLPHLLDLPGYVSREDLPSQICRAHVFAAPSLYEGGPGLVYLEAMACGIPVIACEGSGAAEVVVDEENGLLVPPGNLEALSNALRRLLSNPEERETLGEQARSYVCENADSKKCLRKIEAFYNAVALKSNKGVSGQ